VFQTMPQFFAGAVGTVKVGSNETVSVDDAFHIGSCKKAMTVTVLAIQLSVEICLRSALGFSSIPTIVTFGC